MLDPLLLSYDIHQLRTIAKDMGLTPSGDKRKSETYIFAIREAERAESISLQATDEQPNTIKYLDFGTPISFGYTAQYLPKKTVTRREWKDDHAAKFTNALNKAIGEGKRLRVPAIDKGYHAGGKQIGWLIISDHPYKQRLMDMPSRELKAEGGMCVTVEEFATKYFKGDLDKEVWVVNFKFEPIEIQPQEPIEPVLDAQPDPIPEPILNPPREAKALRTLTSSKSDEHYTPQNIINAAREVMGKIDLDPMSCKQANKIVKATKFYDKETDGLRQPWFGKVWLNPAFSLADEAVANLLQAYLVGVATEALLLIKAAPDTNRHQMLAPLPFCEIRGRVKFIADNNNHPAPFAILVFYLGKNFPKFKEVFGKFGNIRLGQNQVDELESDRRDLLAKVAELQLQLAKKSDADDRRLDWLEDDICNRTEEAESRLKAFDIDCDIPRFEILSRQRVEWTAKLEVLKSLQKSIDSINLSFFGDRQINRPPRPKIEEIEGWRSEFGVGKLVQSGDLVASIKQFSRVRGEWIAICQIRARGESYSEMGREFYLSTKELFTDFMPYKSPENLSPYRLGSVRSSKELKRLFRNLHLPNYLTEVAAPNGSVWQAFKERDSSRCAIMWRCEVLPNGDSRVPRIPQKNDRPEAAIKLNFSY